MSALPMLRTRHAAIVLLVVLIVAATPSPSSAAVTWGGARGVGPPSTWSPGNTLAQAGNRLVTAWSSDCPPPRGRCATDRGPYMGVFAQRAPLGGGLRWSKPFRLSQPRAQAERASIAASGSAVLAGWVTQRSYQRYDGRAPRAFFVRRSTTRGARWSKPIRLSPSGGRVDYPQLAVADATGYAVWTNGDNGAIRLATSLNRGKTWTIKTIGSTTATPVPGEGLAGYPTVGASGANVVVAWFADGGGTQLVKVSNVRGNDFAPGSVAATLAGSSPNDGFHYPVARGAADAITDDIAVAYTTLGSVAVRVYDGSTLGAEVDVLGGSWPTQLAGRNYGGATGSAVQPFGVGGLTVAFAACRVTTLANPCRSTTSGARIELFVTSTSNGGGSWSTPDRLGPAGGPATRVNDASAVVVTGPNRRFVLWNQRNEGFSSYRQAIRVGSGPV
jgi:hypothetical protein